jgi:hypothetical protein
MAFHRRVDNNNQIRSVPWRKESQSRGGLFKEGRLTDWTKSFGTKVAIRVPVLYPDANPPGKGFRIILIISY